MFIKHKILHIIRVSYALIIRSFQLINDVMVFTTADLLNQLMVSIWAMNVIAVSFSLTNKSKSLIHHQSHLMIFPGRNELINGEQLIYTCDHYWPLLTTCDHLLQNWFIRFENVSIKYEEISLPKISCDHDKSRVKVQFYSNRMLSMLIFNVP